MRARPATISLIFRLVNIDCHFHLFFHCLIIPVSESQVDVWQLHWDSVTIARQVVTQMPVPLSTNCSLTWLGFECESQSLQLLAMDSGGVLSVLLCCAGWQWLPAMDTKQVMW